MSVIPVLTDHLDYLQRSQVTAAVSPIQATITTAPLHLRRLWRIHGIRCLDKSQIHRQATGNSQTSGNESPVRLLSEDALIGVYGYKIPIAFFVWGEPEGVAIHLGSWSPKWENASEDTLENRKTIVSTVLKSLYPAIELEKIKEQAMDQPPLAGLALGIPTVKLPHPLDGALPLDRLIRAMYGTNWACLVLAQPVDEGVVINLRKNIINEMRSSETAAKAEGVPSPLAKHYIELLQIELKRLANGRAVGAWRTAVYLLGDMESYYCLASVWRGIYSGHQSLPEPITVLDNPDAAALAVNWAMPDEPGLPGPNHCHYRHPFQYQTLLTSMQLAAYIHLPQLETNGFALKLIPDFDTVPPQVSSDKSIDLGTVIHRGNQTATMYSVSLKSLTRHIFIPGVTGFGKTNTIKYLLKKASELEVPYLVIEPAKREYRSLLSDEESFLETRRYSPSETRDLHRSG